MSTDNNATPTDSDYDKMAQAVADGNTAELDRLMAVEDVAEPAVTVENGDNPPLLDDENADNLQPEVVDPESNEANDLVLPEDKGVTQPAVPEKKEPTIAELQAEIHKLRSDAGRVPHVQSRNAQLEREVAALKAAQAAVKPAEGDALDPETQAVIDELKETDPVLAKAMERVAKMAVSTANAKVSTAFDAYSTAAQEVDEDRFLAEQRDILFQAIPQAPQIFASQEWKQWKQTLSPGRRAMAESSYADEVATAVHAFASDMQRLHGGTPPVVPPAAPVVNEAAEQALRERNRKVQQAAEVKNPAARVTTEFDPDDAKGYDDLYNKLAKANHIL